MLEQVTLWPAIWKLIIDTAEMETQNLSKSLMNEIRKAFPASQRGAHAFLDGLNGRLCASQFRAFFHKNGNHQTSMVPTESWNEGMSEYQTGEILQPKWQTVRPQQSTGFDGAVEQMINRLIELPSKLKFNAAAMALSDTIFTQIIQAHAVGLLTDYNTCKLVYEAAIGEVRVNATSDRTTGFFTQAMVDCYDEGNHDSGNGVTARLKKLLRDYVTRERPFETAADKMEGVMEQIIRTHARSVHDKVNERLLGMEKQMRQLIREGGGKKVTAEQTARTNIAMALPKFVREFTAIEELHARTKAAYT